MSYRDETRNPQPKGEYLSYTDYTRGNPSEDDAKVSAKTKPERRTGSDTKSM